MDNIVPSARKRTETHKLIMFYRSYRAQGHDPEESHILALRAYRALKELNK